MKKLFLSFLLTLSLITPAFAITVDATSTGSANSATSLTFNHTIGAGSNMYLVCGISVDCSSTGCGGTGAPGTVAMTYNGTNMTRSRQNDSAFGSDVEIWYQLAPTAGTHAVAYTSSHTDDDGVAIGCVSFSNATQQAPEAGADGTLLTQNCTATVTTASANAIIFGSFANISTNTTDTVTGTNQTERYNFTSASHPSGVRAVGSTQTTTTTGNYSSIFNGSSNLNAFDGCSAVSIASSSSPATAQVINY